MSQKTPSLESMALANRESVISNPAQDLKPPNTPSSLLERVVSLFLTKVKEPDPEMWSQTLKQKAIRLQDRPLEWLAILFVIHACALLLIAYGCAVSMHTSTGQEWLLWLGLLLIFAPAFFRQLSPLAVRAERIGILCSMSLCIYSVPEILSPLHFFFVDEYMHWRTVNDIVASGHLFSRNAMLPVSPLYPGLEIVTSALSSLSGLSTMFSGLLVVGIARVVVICVLFLLFERITESSRVAAIAAMIYAANASFFLLDSLFVYESLGLAMGTAMLYALYLSEKAEKGQKSFILITCMMLIALVVTHHVSDLFFVALLLVWVLTQKWTRHRLFRSNVLPIAIMGIVLSGVWILFIARPVIGYLSSPAIDSLSQIQGILTGSNHARHLFTDHTNGHPTLLWEQLVMLASIGFVTLGIPFAFLCLWQRYRHQPLPLTLALIALLYPFTQAVRVASVSANIADRSSPYIFVTVSFALATLIAQMWPVRKLKWKQATAITCVISIIFLGEALLGSGPSWRLMPSGYLIGDDARSIDREGIQAALWMPSHTGGNNRIFTNSTNALLMGSYGDQYTVSLASDGVDVAPVLYAPQFHEWEASILQSAHVRYLAIDMRMSTTLPAKGYYFEGEEEPDLNVTTPISRQALTKFDTVSGMNRLFDSGNIVIYDEGDLLNAPQRP